MIGCWGGGTKLGRVLEQETAAESSVGAVRQLWSGGAVGERWIEYWSGAGQLNQVLE